MAGEVIEKIREKEKEAQEIIEKAKLEARKIVEEAKAKKNGFFTEKDKILKRDEENISKKYHDETEVAINELEVQKNREIEEIDKKCEKNLNKVVEYISQKIVEE